MSEGGKDAAPDGEGGGGGATAPLSGGDGGGARARFEDILSKVGDNGKWQIIIFLFTWIEGLLIGFHHLSSSFLGASMDHWCNTDQMSQLPATWSLEQRKNYAIPYNSLKKKFDTCSMYKLPSQIDSDYDTAFAAFNKSRGDNTLSCTTLPGEDIIKKYAFDTSEGITSIVTDWTLVCERLPLLSTVQGSYMGGVFVGCLVWGWASDKYGRRLAMMAAIAIQIVSTIVTAFSVNYIMFVFFRFLVAFSVSGVFECGFVLVTEICGPKFRARFGILTQFPFGIGASLLPVIAYFVRSWVPLQLAISIPSVALVSYYWFVPESPRWLVAKGRFKEALKILKKGADTNSNTLPPDEEVFAVMQKIFEQEEMEAAQVAAEGPQTFTEKLYNFFREIILLVETPEMRKRTLNVFYSWLVVAMVYYGLSFNSKNLGGDRYVNSFISGFVEVPAVVAILPLLNRLGRVKCYCGTFITGGICCGIVALLSFILSPGQSVWLPVTIAMIGKFLISQTFAIAYLYTAELFPTNVRNVAVGTASTFARIGSMSAPYIVDLLGGVHPGIPVIIFGIFSTTAGLFSLMLPETLNRKLPESVAEVERAAKNKGKRRQELEME